VSETMVNVNTAFLAEAIADAYRDGAKDEKARIIKVLTDILEARSRVSPVHSKTIGIKEAIRLIGGES